MKKILFVTFFLLGSYSIFSAKNMSKAKMVLTCTDSYESFNFPNICDSLISPSGKIWKNSGVFNDTIMNAGGCDSIMTFTIAVNHSTTASSVLTGICDSLVSPAGTGKVWYTTGVYKDTIANASGCDSLMTFYLTFGTSESFTITNLCDSLISPAGTGKVWYTTGTYKDTINNAKGCDSVMTFHLTFGTSSSHVLTNLCDSLISPAGTGKVWYTTGIYKDTINNAKGCDSVLTFNLTFGTSATFNMPNICDSLISPSGKVWKTSGMYKDTINNAKGCDSVMTFYIVVGQTTTASFTHHDICDYKISPSGKTWNMDGIYMDTIPNSTGCDSIMTFDLTFKYSTTASFTPPSICDSWISPSGKTVTSSGVFMDTIGNTVGCDSVMTFNLTFKYSTTSSFSPSICDSLVTASGKVYKSSGLIKDTVGNAVGCDSVITYNLTILNPKPVTSVYPASGLVCSGDTIIASGTCANGTLKWFNDAAHTSLKSVGASDTTYVAVPGNYSVYAFCEGTTGCLSVEPSIVSYTVGSIPYAPSTGTATPNMVCVGDSSVISATGCSGGNIEWYDNSFGNGTPVAYGFSTKVAPAVTKSYYAYCVMPGGCKSAFGKTVTVTVDPCNTTSINENSKGNNFKVYPNPFKDNVTISINEEFLKEGVKLTIYNSIGKQVKSIDNVTNSNLTLDVSNYDRGLYFVELTSAGNKTKEMIKIIKQ